MGRSHIITVFFALPLAITGFGQAARAADLPPVVAGYELKQHPLLAAPVSPASPDRAAPTSTILPELTDPSARSLRPALPLVVGVLPDDRETHQGLPPVSNQPIRTGAIPFQELFGPNWQEAWLYGIAVVGAAVQGGAYRDRAIGTEHGQMP